MLAKKSHGTHADLRFAGDFTSISRRCPGTFPLPDCAFMMFRRGFRIISEPNRQIPMCVTEPFAFCMFRNHCDPNLRTKLRRRCVAQGSLSPFCIIALAAFATCNVPMPALMQFHRGFVKLSARVGNFFAWNLNRRAFRRGFHLHFASLPWCHSPPTMYRRRRSTVSRGLLQCFDDMFTKTLPEIRADVRFAGDFTYILRPCPGTLALPDCAVMMYRRGFRIFPIPNRAISMFAA
jgi:hypothetical protein